MHDVKLVSDLGPLAACKRLRHLDCAGLVRVGSVAALSGLSALTYLNCKGTPAADVDVLSGLPNLCVWLRDRARA